MRPRGLALLISLAWAMPASAQTTGPSLLLLDPVGVPDSALAQQLTTSLGDVARALGYHVVTPAPGSAVGGLDPAAGTDLVSVAQRTGVHRSLAIWVEPASAGYEVQVGLASSDGSAASLRASTSAAAITDTATRLLGSLLPAPFGATHGVWGTAAVLAPTTVAPAPAPVTTTPTTTTPARGSRGEVGFVVGGVVSLVLGYVLELVFGLFGGYHDRVCWIGPCSGGTSWDPAWDDFRASSLVPIAGPWIQLAVKPPSEHDAWQEWLVIDGILQGAGAILLFVGIYESGSEAPPPVAVVPWVGPGLVGAMVGGRF